LKYLRIRAKIIEALRENPDGMTLPMIRAHLALSWPAWKRQEISGHKMGGILKTTKGVFWDGTRIERCGPALGSGRGEYQVWFLRVEAV